MYMSLYHDQIDKVTIEQYPMGYWDMGYGPRNYKLHSKKITLNGTYKTPLKSEHQNTKNTKNTKRRKWLKSL
jgi:hypothetical protein